jgi:hypothetical protein
MSQPGQLGRILLTGNQRLDHLPPTQTHDVCDHRVQFDVGVLERLLYPQDVA